MDFTFWIVIWIIFLVVQNVADKKKKKNPPNLPPQNQENNFDFEIPTLANDPNFPGEENQILIEEKNPSAEVREINLEELYSEKKSAAKRNFHETEKISEEVEQKKLPLELNSETAMNAIILSEIFGKPKSLRKK